MQHGVKYGHIYTVFDRNDRVFECFLRQNRPAPQTLGPIYPMLGQKPVKTVEMAENT